jgi:alginate O-acetyltransferase complex protein AlgI
VVFSSYLFLFYFLPAVLLLYYAVPRRTKHLLLTLVSYLFYGWANPLFVFLLLGSTTVDYFCGLVIAKHRLRDRGSPIHQLQPGTPRTRSQRIAVTLSILSNLSLLGFFKYFNFATDNFDAIVSWLGLPELQIQRAITVVLPLGISFYTFQSMSYTIDVYRGHARALRNFIDFACYVSMFPQLVAGPIIRFSEVADQLTGRTHTVTKFARGVAFVSVGLAKKILLANPCGKAADVAFEAGSIGLVDAWYGVIAYAFQIYFDFSAYSDMAIGLGLMLGFVFSKNFDSPYLALAIVMLLGGLWHGAAWNFVVWGGLHGLLLAAERLRGKTSPYYWLPRAGRRAVTFTLVLITWVFFRADDLPAAVLYLRSMFGLGGAHETAGLLSGILYQPYYLGTVLLAALVTWTCPQTWDWTRTITPLKSIAIIGLWLASLAVLATQAYNPFIYFIF